MSAAFRRAGTLGWVAAGALSLFHLESADAAEREPVTLEEVKVEAVKQEVDTDLTSGFLPDSVGTALYTGKKATFTPLRRLPPIANNNYRQAFSQMSGLLISEMNNRGHVNVNYRGIGDPHESQDLLTLKDGIPIGVERFGYSTTYYNPPMEAIERLELIRGGSALLYGPQPGPVLNYVTYLPPLDRAWSPSTQHLFGSNGFYSTLTQVEGTVDRVGYLGYVNHSHSNGARSNEGFDILGGSLKLVLDATQNSRWIWNMDLAESESGEPGRLTLAQYQVDREQTVRPGDRLWVTRYASSLLWERDLSEDTLLDLTMYGGYFDRVSRRRTSNTSTQNNLDRREVSSGGMELRLRRHYDAFGRSHTLTAGSTFYVAEAPRTQDRSATGTYPSDLGNPIFDFDYRTLYGSFFGENQWNFGDLAVVPAFRLELLNQRVQENFNTSKTSPLHNIDRFSVVPLFGLGLKYTLEHLGELYANLSQGYKPAQFDDLAPTGNNTLPATDLDEGRSWMYEAGVRGRPLAWFQYDSSVFLTNYDNLFGTVTVGSNTQRKNVGRAVYQGVDLNVELDLIGLYDAAAIHEASLIEKIGSLSLYGNVSFLSAEFKEGPFRKREVAYAPHLLAKVGLIYRFKDKAKLALLWTMAEDHYWADDNGPGGTGTTGIPAYSVLDFTGEMALIQGEAKLIFGINNVFDEMDFSRVRSDGIEPAPGRNYYGGISVSF